MDDLKNIYKGLIEIVNNNLKKGEEVSYVHFDIEEYIGHDVCTCDPRFLLNIEDDKTFINESYCKMLNRPPSLLEFDVAIQQLQSKKIEKVILLEKLYTSKECVLKDLEGNLGVVGER